MLSQIFARVASFGCQKFCIRYQKYEFGQNLWRILRPHLATLAKIWDHILMNSFFFALIFFTTRPLEVKKYVWIRPKHFKGVFLIEKGGLNWLKIVYHMKLYIYIFFFKYIFAVGSFEGETFSQAPGVLVWVCNSSKIAAKWRCGLPIKKSESPLQ